jgi:hypothetical protein
MINEEYFRSLSEANKLIVDDILSNKSFTLEDLELIQSKMGRLIEQLEFWSSINNFERFLFEYRNYLDWLIEEFS